MKNAGYATLFSEIDTLIRSANTRAARAKIRSLSPNRLERTYLVRYAEMQRRLGNFEASVKALFCFVRPEKHSSIVANSSEVMEYAAALASLGGHREALELLDMVDSTRHSEADFFRALIHMATWDYRLAIDPLERYLGHSGILDYRKALVSVNLAACYLSVDGSHPRTLKKIDDLLLNSDFARFPLLKGNMEGIRSQFFFMLGDKEEFRRNLSSAREGLGGSDTWNALVLDKWKLFGELKFRIRKLSRHSVETEFSIIRRRAGEMRHWETLRDCDLFEGLYFNKSEQLNRCYIGTPYTAFRTRVLNIAGKSFNPPEKFLWTNKVAEKNRQVFDVALGQMGQSSLKAKQIPHRTLQALASDLYRPHSVVTLHSLVFPGQHFIVESSPLVIHQAVKRLRAWLSSIDVDFGVVSRGGFQLEVGKRDALLLKAQQFTSEKSVDVHHLRLLTKVGGRSFSIDDVTSTLNVSLRTARRVVSALEVQGSISKSGTTRSMTYRLV